MESTSQKGDYVHVSLLPNMSTHRETELTHTLHRIIDKLEHIDKVRKMDIPQKFNS